MYVADFSGTNTSRPVWGDSPAVPALFALPLRREVPDGAYTEVQPLCWWSRDRWLAHCGAVFDAHYKRLREEGLCPSVSRETFLRVMAGMAGGADAATGRGCRVPVGRTRRDGTRSGLAGVAGVQRRTVQRARAAARALGVMTVVVPGRRRTLPERLESWRRGDKSRGWCAVVSLHESASLTAVPQTPSDQAGNKNVTPLVRSTGSLNISPKSVVTQRQSQKTRPPSRARTGQNRPVPPARLLARDLLTHPRRPTWMHRHGETTWAAALAAPAHAGWTAEDIVLALNNPATARTFLADPRNAVAYLRHLLGRLDLDAPRPTITRDRDREQAHRKLLAEQQAIRAENAARAAQAAGPASPGRQAALAAARALPGKLRRF